MCLCTISMHTFICRCIHCTHTVAYRRKTGQRHIGRVLESVRSEMSDVGIAAVLYTPPTAELVEQHAAAVWNKHTPLTPVAVDGESGRVDEYESIGVPQVSNSAN